jgi:toxin-antitoxin system PIN domain toxin
MHLPDVNVWLALTFDSHIHHPPAKAWFDNLANDTVCHFCRLTQQGFLRLATNRRVFGKHALTLPKAWQNHRNPPLLASHDRPLNTRNMNRRSGRHDSSEAGKGLSQVCNMDPARGYGGT